MIQKIKILRIIRVVLHYTYMHMMHIVYIHVHVYYMYCRYNVHVHACTCTVHIILSLTVGSCTELRRFEREMCMMDASLPRSIL